MLERERKSRLLRGTKNFTFKAEEKLVSIQNTFCVYCKQADIYAKSAKEVEKAEEQCMKLATRNPIHIDELARMSQFCGGFCINWL